MKNFDIFKYDPTLTINGQEGMKSNLGACFSIFFAMIIILMTYLSGKDLLYKQKPTTYYSTLTNHEPHLDYSDIFFAYSIVDINGQLITDKERYFDNYFGYLKVKRSSNVGEYGRYPALPCHNNTQAFINNTNNILSLLRAKEIYNCASKELNVNLKNTYGDDSFSAWDIKLIPCVNTTINNNHCYPESVRKEKFSAFFGIIVVKSIIINSQNYTNPIEYGYTSFYHRLSIHQSRQDIIYFNRNDFYNDDGFLFEHVSKQSSYDFDTKTSDYLFLLTNKIDYTHRILLTLDTKIKRIERLYLKMQNIASNIGGLFKFLFILFSYFNSTFAKINYFRYLSSFLIKKSDSININWEDVVKDQENKLRNENLKVNTKQRKKSILESINNISKFKNSEVSSLSNFDNTNRLNYSNDEDRKNSIFVNENDSNLKQMNSIPKSKEIIKMTRTNDICYNNSSHQSFLINTKNDDNDTIYFEKLNYKKDMLLNEAKKVTFNAKKLDEIISDDEVNNNNADINKYNESNSNDIYHEHDYDQNNILKNKSNTNMRIDNIENYNSTINNNSNINDIDKSNVNYEIIRNINTLYDNKPKNNTFNIKSKDFDGSNLKKKLNKINSVYNADKILNNLSNQGNIARNSKVNKELFDNRNVNILNSDLNIYNIVEKRIKDKLVSAFHILNQNKSLIREYLEYYLCFNFKSKQLNNKIFKRIKQVYSLESFINMYEDQLMFKFKFLNHPNDLDQFKWNYVIKEMFADTKIDNDKSFIKAIKNA